MDAKRFTEILDEQITTCRNMMVSKADEYATADRLHNFKVAADLQKITVRQALAGMMAKHTVSIYDMCRAHGSTDLVVWEEKITDHLNYLFLLKAVVLEEWAEAIDNEDDTLRS